MLGNGDVWEAPDAVRLRAEPRAGRGSQPVEFVIRSDDAGGEPIEIREKSRFLIP